MTGNKRNVSGWRRSSEYGKCHHRSARRNGKLLIFFYMDFRMKMKPMTALICPALGLSLRTSWLLTVSSDLSIVFCIESIWFVFILICWCLIGTFLMIFGIVRHFDRVLHQVSSVFILSNTSTAYYSCWQSLSIVFRYFPNLALLVVRDWFSSFSLALNFSTREAKGKENFLCLNIFSPVNFFIIILI